MSIFKYVATGQIEKRFIPMTARAYGRALKFTYVNHIYTFLGGGGIILNSTRCFQNMHFQLIL